MLSNEWRHRIDAWRAALSRLVYAPLGEIEFQGFVTRDHLPPAAAQQGPFRPMPPGTRWGGMWEYGWFTADLTLPPATAGERIELRIDVTSNDPPETAVFIDGQACGAIDLFHRSVTIARNAEAGRTHRLLLEAYAGHGEVLKVTGPVLPDERHKPDPGLQRLVGRSTFGIWREPVFQLLMDVDTLYALRDQLDVNLLRVVEIDAGLRDFTHLFDAELPTAEMLQGVDAARARLRPLLDCVNGSTAPTLFAFGHAHIDTAWLWPIEQTKRKCHQTFATQLALMDEYPDYKFLCSQPQLYVYVKEYNPILYERIRAAVQRGQWIAEGGMWIEPDTNIPSGESLIRQFVHGKRFFRDEFGVDSRLMWLPDVFGYSGALPQIMRGCGIDAFSTQKILWTYNDADTFPFNTFAWEGIDGTTIPVHLHNDYNSRTSPKETSQRWNQRVQKDGIATRLFPFGYGDGGGGPTREHLEFIARQQNLEGAPRVRMATPAEYFEDQHRSGMPDNRYVGELYYQEHRGTYTSQAKSKAGNRRCEVALRETELWSAAAATLAGRAVPVDALDAAWKVVLLDQFHDILPGSSITRVHAEAEADYERVLATTVDLTRQATESLIDPVAAGDAWTVFNSLSWPRTVQVRLPGRIDLEIHASDSDPDNTLDVQVDGDSTLVECVVPPCGWTTLRRTAEPRGTGFQPVSSLPSKEHGLKTRATPMRRPAGVRAAPDGLENDLLCARIDPTGRLFSLIDKSSGREWCAAPANELRLFKDLPGWRDAWDIDRMYEASPVALDTAADIIIEAEGPLVARLRVVRQIGQSRMTQKIILRRGSRRIDFETEIDWQETHKLLKVAFPMNVHANEAIHEIQFGHLRRPNHRSRPFDADRFEVCNHHWTALTEEQRGCAVLNDSKYGVNVLGNTIALTLLRAPTAPDPLADRGRQAFTYSLMTWEGAFGDSDVVQQGEELNTHPPVVAGDAGTRSLFSVDRENVIVQTIKPAEDGSGDWIVRLYESMRSGTACRLTTTLPVRHAGETDMLEAGWQERPVRDDGIDLSFRPFEVKTLRLRM